MAVVQPDYDSAPRGRSDASRHRDKIKEAIRRNLPDIISEEAIITRRENQVVRVPIRGLKSYHFRHGRSGGARGGFGSGEGKKGTIIGRRPKPDQGRPGKPGDEPGVDYLETEIELEELIHMMLEDLGLPNLREKEIKETTVPKGWTFDSIEKHGIRPRLDKKRSIREAIKRTEVVVAHLMQETGKPEAECRAALRHAQGDVEEALLVLAGKEPAPAPGEEPSYRLESADLRFRTLSEDVEYQSNAVVLAMMDVSASMDTMKKYLARSFFFWMLSFLKTVYEHVEIRFIAHTTEARLVDEETFFHRGESGGTFCYTAYDLAAELIDTEYPTSRWNVYPFHFSDGEDWEADRTVASLKELLERGVAAFGYGEIQNEYSASTLMKAFYHAFELREVERDDFVYFETTREDRPFLGVILHSREDLYPALRVLLQPD
jgi:hypothetical protein